ncbi:enterobactin synthetase component F [Burkholderiaceae bacterium]|nr:enterobactin synthetase component F [Burkholderiaceae bacterium]
MTTTANEPGDALAQCLRRSFEKYADLPAVEGKYVVLTYRELERRVAALAAALAARGVRMGDLVPMLMARSVDLVVTQLAILRLGASYVPIDLASPAGRQEAMLQGMNAPLLVTDGSTPPAAAGAIALFDVRAPLDAAAAAARSDWATPPDHVAAYVMFTSGTTGAPKGVMVPRSGIVRLVVDADYAEFRPGARWGFLSSPAFDASTLEVWGPLLNGGCCVVQEDAFPTLDDLAEFLLDRRITDAWLTAALFNAMVDDRLDAFVNLRQLLTGGERVSPRHAQTVLEAMPALRLINGYGPTENTTFTLCHTITLADTQGAAGIPIGRPIRGTVVRVDGTSVQPEEGELLAGGAGIAHGYLNDDELTSRKFVCIGGTRWYRTGDLVRRRPDGVYEFNGRVDRQVKVQGHRIELDEVESLLAACPGVGEAAIVVRGDSAESRHLVGCFTGIGASLPATDAVSEFLQRRLPAAAVPRALVPLASMPLNVNGKLDRAALAALADQHVLQTSSGDDHWQSDTEWQLAAIWKKCLRVQRLHRGADFHALGGTSLLALQISAQVRRQLARDLSPIDVLRFPLLADLARRVDDSPPFRPNESPVHRGGSALALTQGQQAMLAATQLDASGCAYLVHVALHVAEPVDSLMLRRAFEGLSRQHVILRMRIEPAASHGTVQDDLAAGWWSEHPQLDQPPADLEWPQQLLDIVNRPMDLRAQGVMRVDHWRVRGGSSLLVWTLHHVAIDEAGIDLCLKDLDQLLRGADLQPTYGAPHGFAAIEKAWADDSAVRAWAHKLVDALRGQKLPLERAPAAGGEVAVAIPSLVAGQLQERCDSWGITPFSTLLAAYGMALQEVFGSAWRFVSTPVSRRSEPELVEPVGYLLDLCLIEAGSRDLETKADTLARVRVDTLDLQRPSFLLPRPLAEAIAEQDADIAGRLNAFCFTWRLEPSRSVPLGPAMSRLLRVPQRGARFGMTLHASLVDGRLVCTIEAVRSAFVQGHVDAVARAFVRQLGELCSIGDLPKVESRPAEQGNAPQPIDPQLESTLWSVWQRWVSARPDITRSTHFLRSGGNSLTVMRMAAQLRREHGLRIDAGAFLADPTFTRLCELACATGSQKTPGVCVMVGEVDAPNLLVLVPGKGGQALGLYKLAEHVLGRLGHGHAVAVMDLEAMLAQAPLDRPLWFLQERMRQLVHELGPERIAGFVGFSLGGLLAIRLAREFPRQPPPPVWLLDSYAPRLMARKTWSRRLERRLSSLLWRSVSSGRSAAPPDESQGESSATEATLKAALWDQIQADLAAESAAGPRLEVHLVQARQSLDHVGLVWRRGSNGFDPRQYAKWYVHRLDAMHLDLPRALAADTAALFATGLRWGPRPLASA